MSIKMLASYAAVRILKQLASCYALYFAILLITQLVAPGHDPLGMPFRMLGALPSVIPLMLGLVLGSSDVSFLVQNGLTRRQIFCYVVVSIAFIAFVMTCVEVICMVLLPFWTGQSVYYLIRGEVSFIPIYIGVFLSNFVIALCSFLAVTLFLRLGNKAMIVVTSLVIVVPVISLIAFGSVKPAMDVTLVLAGLTLDGEGTSLSAIVTFAIEAAVLLPVVFIVLRRLEVSHSLRTG